MIDIMENAVLGPAILKGERDMLTMMLEHEFGALPAWGAVKLANAKEPQLLNWGKRLVLAETLDEVFQDNALRLPVRPLVHKRMMTEALGRGVRQGKSAVVIRLLERRFGALPDWVGQKLGNATEAEIMAWAERVLSAQSLNDVFKD
jgi:hypothetical protein